MRRLSALAGFILAMAALASAQVEEPIVPGSSGEAIAIRTNGGLVIAGITEANLDGQSSASGLDIFVAWLTEIGELERLIQLTFNGDQRVGGMTLGPNNEIYIAGDTTEALPFTQGTGTQFLVKLTPTGDIDWGNSFGGDTSYTAPALTLQHGEVIVTGSLPNGEGENDPEAGWQPYYDAQVLRFSTDGNELSRFTFKVDANQTSTGVIPTTSGDLINLGRRSTERFRGYESLRTHGFAARLTTTGTVLEDTAIGYVGDATFAVRGVPLRDGRVAIATGSGMGFGEPEDGPPFGTLYYAVLGVLDSNLEQVWLKSIGAGTGYIGTGVAGGPSSDLVLVGYGGSGSGAENIGVADVFVTAHSASGDRLWVTQYGTAGFDRATAVATTSDGMIFVTGHWDGTRDHNFAGLESVGRVGSSWFVSAHAPNGDRLWFQTYP